MLDCVILNSAAIGLITPALFLGLAIESDTLHRCSTPTITRKEHRA